MTNNAAGSDRPHIDELLCRAEEMARVHQLRDNRTATLDEPRFIGDDNQLLTGAVGELRRLSLRRQHLPHCFITDTGWLIMVDLLVCEMQAAIVLLDEAAERWNLSDQTAARKLAALIASGLILRSGDLGARGTALKLTAQGRATVISVLAVEM